LKHKEKEILCIIKLQEMLFMPTPILPCLEPFKKECSVEKCRLLCMIKNQTKRKKKFFVWNYASTLVIRSSSISKVSKQFQSFIVPGFNTRNRKLETKVNNCRWRCPVFENYFWYRMNHSESPIFHCLLTVLYFIKFYCIG